MERDDVRKTIEGDVAAEHLVHDALRLERNDVAGGPDRLRERDGMRADVRADVDDGSARLEERGERSELRLAPLSVEVERAPDEAVVDVEHQHAVPTGLDRDVATLHQPSPHSSA